MKIRNIAVKSENRNLVESNLKTVADSYLSDPINGWIAVFPSGFSTLPDIAKNLSEQLKTITIFGEVYDSDDLDLQVFENGKKVFEYGVGTTEFRAPEITYGDISVFLRNGPPSLTSEAVEKILFADKERHENEDALNIPPAVYVFEEDRYRDLLKLIGAPEYLAQWDFGHIKMEEGEKPPRVKLPPVSFIKADQVIKKPVMPPLEDLEEKPTEKEYFIRFGKIFAETPNGAKELIFTTSANPEDKLAGRTQCCDKVRVGETLCQAVKRALKTELGIDKLIGYYDSGINETAKNRFGELLPRTVLVVKVEYQYLNTKFLNSYYPYWIS